MQDIIVTYKNRKTEEIRNVERIELTASGNCFIETDDLVWYRSVNQLNSIMLGTVDRIHVQNIKDCSDRVLEDVSEIMIDHTGGITRVPWVCYYDSGAELIDINCLHVAYDIWL